MSKVWKHVTSFTELAAWRHCKVWGCSVNWLSLTGTCVLYFFLWSGITNCCVPMQVARYIGLTLCDTVTKKCCWFLWLPLARNMRDGIRRAHQGFWCISWLWYCLDAVLGRSRWKRRSKGNKQCCLYGKFWGWYLDIKRVVATIYSKPLPLL